MHRTNIQRNSTRDHDDSEAQTLFHAQRQQQQVSDTRQEVTCTYMVHVGTDVGRRSARITTQGGRADGRKVYIEHNMAHSVIDPAGRDLQTHGAKLNNVKIAILRCPRTDKTTQM